MQKKRPRSNSGTRKETLGGPESPQPAQSPQVLETPETPESGRRRPVRVRSRLVTGVALVGLTVVAAGAPAVLTASGELTDSQRLVTLAELNRQAVTLAHSLADERDEVTAYVAAGRDEQAGEQGARGRGKRQISATRSARVDRQIDEIREAAPTELRRDLAGVPSVRRTALTGKGTALEAYKAYTDIIAKLQALADQLAERTPARAAEATRAPAALGLAVEQASATRGLLLAALSVPTPRDTGNTEGSDAAEEAARTRNALTAAAQQSRVRELAALADFDQAAGSSARDSLAATVTGPDVKSAENQLARLTDRPELSKSERKTDREALESALSARIEQMRGVESALAAGQVERLAQVRDDDVTALELRVALLGGCLLLAVGISTAVARTLTRPLAVLRIGAARLAAAPDTEEPIRFTGRNDEFAQVVRSLNALHGKLRTLGVRVEKLDGDRADLMGAREALTDELAARRAELQEQTARLTAELERLNHTVHHTFVNLALRSLGLVERQLGVIEKLEEREQDPERLATLFKLDHMATVMRRHSENLLILAGSEHGQAHHGPVPLVDVLRAAVSEIERYERVTIQSLPPHSHIAGFAADDLSHLIAELLENATSFSPPDAQVQLSGWLLESGEIMLSVQDEGIGMTENRLGELNARLAAPGGAQEADPADMEGEGLGIRVTALLAARHGVRVQLREQKQGGIAAVVVLPQALLPAAPPTAVPPAVSVAGTAPTLNLPGSVAEANSNALPSRAREIGRTEPAEPEVPAEPDASAEPGGPEVPVDPLVAAAEQAIRDTEEPAAEEAGPETTLQVRIPDPRTEARGEPTAAQEPEAGAEPGTGEPGTREPGIADPGIADPGTAETRSDASERPRDPGTRTEEPEATDEAPAPGPYAIGPDAHERAEDPAERLTDKGLPKRTPKIVTPASAPGPRRGSGVDAEALRRRLGGFHRGAENGRRDVEAEIADLAEDAESTQRMEAVRTDEKTGDTVEEARS